ncbi:MAG: hypothetical protein PHV85_07010 [Desulfovibrionaceae bacterium]|nr:hypothetical protein [Desulfovibrionaceae bacterium]MDD4952278.1 hypothetical protein [Desulfovibrionaceae bacterium]
MKEILRLHQAYKRLFEGPDGRTVLEDLKGRGFVRASTFSTHPGRIQFNEGRRSMVLHVMHMKDEENFKNIMEEGDEQGQEHQA